MSKNKSKIIVWISIIVIFLIALGLIYQIKQYFASITGFQGVGVIFYIGASFIVTPLSFIILGRVNQKNNHSALFNFITCIVSLALFYFLVWFTIKAKFMDYLLHIAILFLFNFITYSTTQSKN